jgi:transposase
LKQWHKKTSKSAIILIQKMSKTVKDHWDGILSYFESELTTGFLEGINSLIQAAKARARGYRNPRNMISMAYLIAGKLKFNKLYAQPT